MNFLRAAIVLLRFNREQGTGSGSAPSGVVQVAMRAARRWLSPLLLPALLWPGLSLAAGLPPGFVYLDQVAPSIQVELAYNGKDNFVGRPIAGYGANRAILTQRAAEALVRAQRELEAEGLGLKVLDAYRPQRAVRQFYRWAQDPKDQVSRARYYPDFSKPELFRRGYIARQSSHSRGSTVDVTLIDRDTRQELDMGSAFDFFGPISAYHSKKPTPAQQANRQRLREALTQQGFAPFDLEWWHFTLQAEPFPRGQFDFEVR